MGQYQVTAPCAYTVDGVGTVHRRVGVLVEVDDAVAATLPGALRPVNGSPLAELSSDVVSLPQSTVVQDPAEPEPVADPVDDGSTEEPVDDPEPTAAPETVVDEPRDDETPRPKPRPRRGKAAADGTD